MKNVLERKPEPPFFDERGAFHFRPVTSDARLAWKLDALPSVLMGRLLRFETNCSLDCCGLSALEFQLPTEWDKRWNFDFAVVRSLDDLIDHALSLEAEVVHINELKENLYTDDWLFLLRYLKENIEETARWK